MNEPGDASSSEVVGDSTGDDAALLALERRFDEITAHLLNARAANEEPVASSTPRRHDEADTKQIEAILERLYPIERAIMQIPACTIAGLGVKARHDAHVMSQYWERPIDQIDWNAQATRLVIEAICDCVRTPLPFSDSNRNK